MIGNMFKTTRHKRFDYKPRFFDPVQDELEERIKSKEFTGLNDRAARRYRISDGIRRNQGHSSIRKESTMRANLTIAAIAGILVLMSVLLLGNLGG